jgi:beta-N-acetylhexosaminidase
MELSLEQMIGQRLLLAFHGKDSSVPGVRELIRRYKPAGLSLFRTLNLDSVEQIRLLTAGLQAIAREEGLPPLLIGTDQEGGQLMAIGDRMTLLPGNMALGAAGSEDLARKAGRVVGTELAAVGVNVNYAPICDVNVNPLNPVIGIRSFGEDPQEVGHLAAAMIDGIQSCGVAATAKHFPGYGDTTVDPHFGIPTLAHDLEHLRRVEFPPFRAAAQAGARMIMSAHIALPALDGNLPVTFSSTVLKSILRDELGYRGVIVTDAMDMHTIRQGDALKDEAIRAVHAGADLVLVTSRPDDHRRIYDGLLEAARGGRLDMDEMRGSIARIGDLKQWQGGHPQPGLEVIGSMEHAHIAREIAAQSLTLVRDDAGLLPLRLNPGERAAVIFPRPLDLTPADTSSFVMPTLAANLRQCCHVGVDEFILSHLPTDAEISAVSQAMAAYKVAIVGTLNANSQSAQARLVKATLQTGVPTIVVAMRLPYDLAAFPEAPTFVCSYSILDPSMQMLAQALTGEIPFRGRLPVAIPGLYARGHGIVQSS